MKLSNINLLDIVKTINAEEDLLKGCFGLEKENVRVDKNGKLALTSHPESFGNKIKNPFITIDFSESQSLFIAQTTLGSHVNSQNAKYDAI